MYDSFATNLAANEKKPFFINFAAMDLGHC